jgi:hypothetical protein
MAMVCECLGLKIARTVFAYLVSKLIATVSDGLASKHVATVSGGLASKSAVMVSLGLASKPVLGFFVEPKNQGGGGFPGLGLKTDIYDLVIWVSKSPRRFLGFGLKTK